jgi:hypothetical protein
MRRQIAVVMCSLVFGIMTLSSHAIAQQKTVQLFTVPSCYRHILHVPSFRDAHPFRRGLSAQPAIIPSGLCRNES